MLLPELRRIVCDLHAELPKNNLVAWTSGNVSARDPETGLVVIKPSGIKFQDLTPENMVVVSVDGKIVEAAHLLPAATLCTELPGQHVSGMGGERHLRCG